MSVWRVFAVVALMQSSHIYLAHGESAGVTCKPLDDCTLLCPFGYENDSNNCPICSCNDLCKGYDCGLYEVCEVRVPFCTDQGPCPPRAVCVPKPVTGQTTTLPTSRPSSSPGSGVDICLQPPTAGQCDLMSTSWFFNVTALKCQSFRYGGCGGNGNNFLSEGDCLARCLPTSMPCPAPSCSAPCQLQWNSKGCQTCVCPGASCKDILCLSSEECRIVDGQCSTPDEVCYPRPECQPKSDSTVMMSTPYCPPLECELMPPCDYGIKKDQYGCKTCTCYDPCETFECPVGQRCALTRPSDCPPGSECRDAPSRYCTDETPPPTTRDRPSSEQLMSCCVAGGMSEICQPLCTPNLTISTVNVPTLMQCASELKTYLNCAGGGESYTSCCTKKSVGPSCYGLCAGNSSIDTTNPHSFSECIMSYDLNEVINCYLEGLPDARTTAAMVTSGMIPSSSTQRSGNLEVCTQPMDTGSCDGVIPRWYFNPNTVSCEEFNYGGCEGNGNNFHTQDACVAACMQQVPPICPGPEPICDLNCQPAKLPNGCSTCVCTSSGMSSTHDVTSKFSTPVRPTTTPRMSLQDCCMQAGVSDQCMPFCSFEFNFDASHLPRLIACQSYLNIGLRCAKGEKTYTKCCQDSGVSGECLESCGSTVNITDVTCVVTQHSDMLSCFSNEQSDDKCSRLTCPTDTSCAYGYKKDANGCKTCDCLDPCKDVVCGVGQTCTYKETRPCVGDICEIEYLGECTDCIEPQCNTSCQYGKVKDPSGCSTCQCSDPCQDAQCETGYTCKVIPSRQCESVDCQITYEASCTFDCPAMPECAACEFGYEKDVNGCNTCQCYDPCKNKSCSDSQVCVPLTVPTFDGQDIKEVFVGECRNVCMPPACNKYCKYGYKKESNGCDSATCECNDPCQNVTCDNVYICQPRRVELPGEYIGECVQCSGMLCDIRCDYETVMLTPACPLCECFDPCQSVTCGVGEVCKRKQGNATSDNPQSYTAVCERTHICPAVICSNPCPYGITKDSNGCETCDCYDPCQGIRCLTGMECEVKVDSHCLTGNCSEVAFAACVPPRAPCIKNAVTSTDSDMTSALSNCDMEGYYKPLQCDVTDVSVCRCTSRMGENSLQGLTLIQGIDKCFPADKIVGLLTMHADFEIIKPGDGVVFKQNISKQIGDAVGLPDTNVTITEFRAGSILIDFVISCDNQSIMDLALSKLQTYAERNQMIAVQYEGEHYHATFDTFLRMGPYVHTPTSIPPTTKKPGGGLSRAELLSIVIIVPVLGTLLIAVIVTLCLCKFVRKEKPLISDSVRSSMSFDSVLAEKGERPKSGYENPTYDNSKIRPVSGTFSTGTTTA